MFDLKKLRESALREGMKLMGDPRVMKLMSNPKVMNVMMKAFQLRGTVQTAVDDRVKQVARSLKLATREDVSSLRSTISSLERTLKQVESKLEESGGKAPPHARRS